MSGFCLFCCFFFFLSFFLKYYCPLQIGCQEGLGNRWMHFVLWFTQLHGLYRTWFLGPCKPLPISHSLWTTILKSAVGTRRVTTIGKVTAYHRWPL